jgi:hypothetical protein
LEIQLKYQTLQQVGDRMVKIEQFSFDPNFFFLIQKITKESSQEILSYFFDLTRILAEDAYSNSKAYRPCKKAVAAYKNTNIPFMIEVLGRRNNGFIEQEFLANVCFPKKKDYLDGSKMESVLMEMSLGLISANIPDFSKPATRIPKSLRDIEVKKC